MNQIKSDDTVISLCVGRLLVSVPLTPSLTPDFFFSFILFLSIDLGQKVLIHLEKKKIISGLWMNFQVELLCVELKSPQPKKIIWRN